MNYQEYASQFGGVIESIGGQLYDTLNFSGIGAGGTTQLTYFTALRNNLALSNMELAGTLPSPKGFLIRAIRVGILQRPMSVARAATGAVQPGALDNICQLINTGVGTLFIGSKNYGQFPLWLTPQGSAVFPVRGADGNAADPGQLQDTGCNGMPDIRNVRTLSKPIFLGPQINFRFDITWPAVLTLAGPAGDLNTLIQVILDGDLLRPVQ